MRGNQALGMVRDWLGRPVSIRSIALPGYLVCLGLIAWAPLGSESLPAAFWTAIALGILAICAGVYSPDLNPAGSRLAAFFLVFVMHGLVTWVSFRAGYYPRSLAGSYFGQALQLSALFVLLEWGATILIGQAFSAAPRPTVLRGHTVAIVAVISLAALGPVSLARGYSVEAGAAPARYRQFSVNPAREDAALETPLVNDVFLKMEWDRKEQRAVLNGWDIKRDHKWTVDLAPPRIGIASLPLPSFAVERSTGVLLVVTELLHINAAGDRLCWVIWVDVQSGTKIKAEELIRAPWLEPSTADLLFAGWETPPLGSDRPVTVGQRPDGSMAMEGRGFRWRLRGEGSLKAFITGDRVVVMRELWNEKSLYHIFLLPEPGS